MPVHYIELNNSLTNRYNEPFPFVLCQKSGQSQSADTQESAGHKQELYYLAATKPKRFRNLSNKAPERVGEA